MTTHLSAWGHSCIRLTRAGNVLVIDPGSFSDLSVLADADAVLVTHEHPDHVDVPALVARLLGGEALEVWAPGVVIDQVLAAAAEADAPASDLDAVLHRVGEGDRFTAAGFDVQAVGSLHAEIHPDVPTATNHGYLVDTGDGTVLHPGDAVTWPEAATEIDVLLTPVGGPWLKLSEAVDLVRAVGPGIVVPIHDAHLSPSGLALADRLLSGLGGSPYLRLAPGDVHDLGDPVD